MILQGRAMITRLTVPAPRSCPYTTESGGWALRAWTAADVVEARSAGAYFVAGRHNFADNAAIKAAGLSASRETQTPTERLLKRLPKEQLEILRTTLKGED